MNKESNLLKLEKTTALNSLAKKASQSAIKVSKALDLSVQYVKNNCIIEQNSNGKITIIKELDKVDIPIKLKKGAKIYLK